MQVPLGHRPGLSTQLCPDTTQQAGTEQSKPPDQNPIAWQCIPHQGVSAVISFLPNPRELQSEPGEVSPFYGRQQ